MTADPAAGRQWIAPAAGLLLVVLAFVVVHWLTPDVPVPPLERGLQWLASKQADDGAWRGEQIAVLRPGPAMTAFVLHAMTRLPEPARVNYTERMNRAARYLATQIHESGRVGETPDGPDYPNYATSLTVLSFLAIAPSGWETSVPKMVAYLKQAQLDESEGWTPQDREYGGWAFGGASQPKPYAHRLDVSTTRFVLEALSAAKVPVEDPVWERARKFLAGCQNKDGGFHFTPLEGQNKAEGMNSYGSATADGLLGLRFAKGPQDRIEAAEAWISSKFTAERCPGFAPDHPRPWGEGLRGYWLAAASRITDAPKRSEIARVVSARQRPDGSWINASGLMLEDEPLLATTLAILALTDSLR